MELVSGLLSAHADARGLAALLAGFALSRAIHAMAERRHASVVVVLTAHAAAAVGDVRAADAAASIAKNAAENTLAF